MRTPEEAVRKARELLDEASENWRDDDESRRRRSEAIGGVRWLLDRAIELMARREAA